MTSPARQHDASHQGRRGGWPALAVAVLALAIVWTVVFPWLGTRPTVRAHIEQLDREGIDPAALFYSDIEAMPRIEAKLAAERAEHPEAFWGGDE